MIRPDCWWGRALSRALNLGRSKLLGGGVAPLLWYNVLACLVQPILYYLSVLPGKKWAPWSITTLYSTSASAMMLTNEKTHQNLTPAVHHLARGQELLHIQEKKILRKKQFSTLGSFVFTIVRKARHSLGYFKSSEKLRPTLLSLPKDE